MDYRGSSSGLYTEYLQERLCSCFCERLRTLDSGVGFEDLKCQGSWNDPQTPNQGNSE